MNQQKKIDIVQGIQDYIKENPSLELEGMYEYIGYSKRHADRIFSEVLHMTPKEYVRKVILKASAEEIVENNESIINIAMSAGYETHEGFSRAFKRNFNINPDDYNKEIPKGFEVIEIEAGMMLVFRSETFEDEKDFGIALDCTFRGYENYNPREYGYEYDFTMRPKFNYGATPEVGAKLAFPVRKIK